MACTQRYRSGTFEGGRRALRFVGTVVLGLGLLFAFADAVGARMVQVPMGSTSGQQAEAPAAPAQAAPVTDGPTLFRERGCEHCHEIRGVGGHKGPDLSGVGRRLKDAAIERQIVSGGDAMPAFGEALPAEEIAALVKYLDRCRDKQKRVSKGVAKARTPVAAASEE